MGLLLKGLVFPYSEYDSTVTEGGGGFQGLGFKDRGCNTRGPKPSLHVQAKGNPDLEAEGKNPEPRAEIAHGCCYDQHWSCY